MTRTEAAERWNRLLAMLDKRYVGAVYKALISQVSSFTSELKSHGIEYARHKLSTEVLNLHIIPVLLNIHKSAGVVLAQQTFSSLRKSPVKLKYQGFGHNEQWIQDIQDYFNKYLLEKAVLPISKTTRDRILSVLEKGIAEGWSIDEMVHEIENRDMLRARAQTIVRTETVRAANYGILVGADTYDYKVEKEWLAVEDNRTRHSHRFIDGQKREPGEVFSNNLLFPGDPNGPGSETINCRCRLVMKAARDERGRLIPKEPVYGTPGQDLIRQINTL